MGTLSHSCFYSNISFAHSLHFGLVLFAAAFAPKDKSSFETMHPASLLTLWPFKDFADPCPRARQVHTKLSDSRTHLFTHGPRFLSSGLKVRSHEVLTASFHTSEDLVPNIVCIQGDFWMPEAALGCPVHS